MKKLETLSDKENERHVAQRLFEFNRNITWAEAPEFSAVDLIGFSDGKVVNLVEIKTRMLSREETQGYYPAGLILKRRKLDELIQLGDLLNVPALVLFAFDHGRGEIMSCVPSTIGEKKDTDVGRRDRNLKTDLEPVILLDWLMDLNSFLPKQLVAS